MHIERWFKLEFIVKFCLLVIAGIFFIGILLYIVGHKNLGATYSQAISAMVSFKKILLTAIIMTVFIQVVIISIVAIFISLYASHKIAGPIYRLEKNLEAIGDGDLSAFEIRLRDKDQIQELAKSFEAMCCGFKGKVRKIRDALQKIEEEKKKLNEMIEDKGKYSKDDFESIESVMHEEIEGLKGALKEFHV